MIPRQALRRQPSQRASRQHQDREAGAAMLIAVLVVLVIGVLGASVAVLATTSTRSSGDAKTSLVVKDLANAGLAQGVAYLRETTNHTAIDALPVVPDGAAACQEPTVNTVNPSWTRGSAAQVNGGAQGTYTVWVEKQAEAAAGESAKYRVCAQGKSGQGTRTASVRAEYSTVSSNTAGSLYMAYAGGTIDAQKQESLFGVSAFSGDCIYLKKGLDWGTAGTPRLDPAGRPIAAHSTQYVIDDHKGDCGPTNGSRIHKSGPVYSALPYGTDAGGGNASSFVGTYPYLNTAPWNGSTLNPTDLTAFRAKWGLYDPFSQMSQYRAAAQAQGNLYVITDGKDPNVAAPSAAHPNAVIYVDFQGKAGTYNFKHDGFATERPGGLCQAGKSLILVVANGNVNVQGNTDINAVVIVDGDYNNNGNAYVYGGIFARGSLDLGSAGGLMVDSCAINNAPPGGTSSPSPSLSNYQEYDR